MPREQVISRLLTCWKSVGQLLIKRSQMEIQHWSMPLKIAALEDHHMICIRLANQLTWDTLKELLSSIVYGNQFRRILGRPNVSRNGKPGYSYLFIEVLSDHGEEVFRELGKEGKSGKLFRTRMIYCVRIVTRVTIGDSNVHVVTLPLTRLW